MQLVVSIAGSLWKHRFEGPQVRCDAVRSRVQPPDGTLVEVARGGVERTVENLREFLQHPAVHFEDPAPHIDDIESRARANLERDARLVDTDDPIPIGPRV